MTDPKSQARKDDQIPNDGGDLPPNIAKAVRLEALELFRADVEKHREFLERSIKYVASGFAILGAAAVFVFGSSVKDVAGERVKGYLDEKHVQDLVMNEVNKGILSIAPQVEAKAKEFVDSRFVKEAQGTLKTAIDAKLKEVNAGKVEDLLASLRGHVAAGTVSFRIEQVPTLADGNNVEFRSGPTAPRLGQNAIVSLKFKVPFHSVPVVLAAITVFDAQDVAKSGSSRVSPSVGVVRADKDGVDLELGGDWETLRQVTARFIAIEYRE